METKNGINIKLGILVTLSVILLLLVVYFIGSRKQLFGSTFEVHGIFKDISGLQEGNNVRFSGINVGIIENIQQISDSTVLVIMSINGSSKPFIKKNATIVIGSDGLVGSKIAIILPGVGGFKSVENGDTLNTLQPLSMDDILVDLKKTTENAAMITEDLSIIISGIRSGKGTIGKLFMDSAFAETMDDAMLNIKKGAGGFSQNMEAAKSNFLLKGYFKKKEKKEIKK